MKIWQLCVAGTTLILLIELASSDICRCAGPCANNICSCSNSTGSYEISCSICESRERLTASEGIILSHNFEEFTNSSGYVNLTSCSVLIESPVGTTIRLYLYNFKTECSWDFLHFHDGISPFAPTMGIYGGPLILDGEVKLLKQDSELVSTSNQMYIVFRPDEYVNHDGFSIYYRVDGCPKDCSDHGKCVSGRCECDASWQGDMCEIETCRCDNGGTCQNDRCVCQTGYSGENCQIDTASNRWSYLKSHSTSIGGRAGFGGALLDNTYWVFGGYRMTGTTNGVKMAKYDILTNTWSKETDSGPSDRDGHTLTAYKNYLFMFGGQVSYQITDDLWKYDVISSQWHQLNTANKIKRISSMGHCAVLINSTIYFIGGIDGNGIPIIDIQTYAIEKNRWNIIGHRQMTRHYYTAQSRYRNFQDVTVYHRGRYGHSCVHNPVTDRITVFGGLNTTLIMGESMFLNGSDKIRESTFVEYDTYLKHWSNLWVADKNTAPMVYLSAVGLVGRSLVILGGRYIAVGEDKCYNTAPYIINLETGEGREVKSFEKLKHVGPVRMGHGSFVYNNSVYFFGGYNGKLHDDFIVYTFGKCEDHTNKTRCVSTEREDFNNCSWNETTSACYNEPLSDCGRLKCDNQCIPGDGFDRRCVACQRRENCTWDQNYPDTCRPVDLVDSAGFIDNYACRNVPNAKPSRIECQEYLLCEHCKNECVWKENKCIVNYEHAHEETDCKTELQSCTKYTTCNRCTQQPITIGAPQCMWCQLDKLSPDGSRVGQCLDSATYYARYPYGQCVQWSMYHGKSSCPATDCSDHGNCTLCQSQPECGWCDDASGTGTGTCHSGTYHGPLDSDACRSNAWFYDTCPLCQCNGHSNCTDSIHCDQCQGNTKGDHCDACIDGFHGDATNNGLCKPCDCSRHSEPYCNSLSGRCWCNTEGVTGIRCDTCLRGSQYTGDPTKLPYGTCYYTLSVYSTFQNKSVKRRKVNFMMKLDSDVTDDVNVRISSYNYSQFYINSTIFYTDVSSQDDLKQAGPQTTWKDSYKISKYDWDKREAELRLYLEFFGYPPGGIHYIDVEVSQATTQIDLKQFFIIFFSCIIVLLLVFLLAWTAKIRYSQYRSQRNQEIQLLERALRPFKTHKVLFKNQNTPTPGRIFEVRPLGIEPLSEEKYGIVSYLLTMPGPKDVNVAIVSSSFVSSLSYGKVISNPNIHNINFEA